MKLTPDSPEITAYAVGETTAEEHALIEKALAESPELRAEIQALRRLADTLETELSAESAPELDEARRERVLAEAENPGATAAVAPEAAVGPFHAFRQLWIALTRPAVGFSLAAATAVCVALVLWTPWKGGDRVPPGSKPVRGEDGSKAKAPGPGNGTAPKDGPETAAEAKSGAVLLSAAAPPRRDENAVAELELVQRAASGRETPATPTAPVRSGENRFQPLDRVSNVPGAAAVPNRPDALLRDPAGSAGPLAAKAKPAVGTALRPVPAEPAKTERFLGLAGGAAPAERGLVRGSLAERDFFAAPSRADGAASLGFREHQELPSIEARSSADPAIRNRYGLVLPPSAPAPGERYQPITENPFREVAAAPLSTFGMDVDTASYANARRFLREGSLPPRDAVRLEELVNYFPYDYAGPKGREPFAANVEVSDCPWNPEHRLVRIGLKARDTDVRERPRANLVFLVDVSGSMAPENKLPLVQRSLRLLLDQLDPKDQVGIVTYAGEADVALTPTPVSRKAEIQRAIDALRAGSGTHGSAGIERAYAMATNAFVRGGVNRVILCTDGDFNVGATRREDLLDLVTEKAKSGVFLSVLGYGADNLRDDNAELLADRGNGNYSYIDSFTEARKVLKEEVRGNLQTVAKDAKVQVEFNPARVASWRLLGYENRALADRDFNDDKKDAGEVGAGQAVTVLYEVVPTAGRKPGVDPLRYAKTEAAPQSKAAHGDELLNLKVRYKEPEGETSRLLEVPVRDPDHDALAATADFKFAAAVVGYGLMLRDSPLKGDLTWDRVLRLAEEGLGPDREGYRAEFIDLVRRAKQLSGR